MNTCIYANLWMVDAVFSLKFKINHHSCSPWHRLLDSLVVECWYRVRKVPGSIPSQGPRHTKDVTKMVPVVPLFSTEHSKGKILALSQELRKENNVMDKIWDRKSIEVGGHWPLWWGWKNRMTTQNRQKSNDKNHTPYMNMYMYILKGACLP